MEPQTDSRRARSCRICERPLSDGEELYWGTHCEQCAARSMDDCNEDFEKFWPEDSRKE